MTKAEYEAWLVELREHHKQALDALHAAYARNVDVPDDIGAMVARLSVAISSLGDIRVESDRDADLVWRGSEVGMAFAVLDIDELAKSWSTSRKKSTENLKRNQRPALTDERADAAMLKCGNNISAAARSLRVNRKTLERHLERRRSK
jgi:hypothetical protein